MIPNCIVNHKQIDVASTIGHVELYNAGVAGHHGVHPSPTEMQYDVKTDHFVSGNPFS